VELRLLDLSLNLEPAVGAAISGQNSIFYPILKNNPIISIHLKWYELAKIVFVSYAVIKHLALLCAGSFLV
jgi:hypothetical protein